MAKPIQAPESFVDLPFPVKGIDVATELELQPKGTTPLGQNVRAFEPSTQRARGGARPGLVKYINTQVLGLPSTIQHLNIIVDPTEAALNFDFTGDLPDPSTNNLRVRNWGRLVRRGGSGAQPNIHPPKGFQKVPTPPPPPAPGGYPIPLPAGGIVAAYTGVLLQDMTVVGVSIQVNVTRSYFLNGVGHQDSAVMSLTVLALPNGPLYTGDSRGAISLAPRGGPPYGIGH